MSNELPRVRVVNSNGGWIETECYIDEKKVDKVKRIDFSVGVDELPTFVFETIGIPDIDMRGIVIFDCKPKNVIEAIKILRSELVKHEDLYNAFLSSIDSVLNEEPGKDWTTKELSSDILNRIIGED